MNGATRLQPVVMQTGQAAGALAALAAKSGRTVKEVGIREVQDALLEAGGYLLPLLDAKPGDLHFKALQRVASTGIMECEGRNEGWSNQTWFRAGDAMMWKDISPALYEYWPEAELSGIGEMTVGEAFVFIFSLAGDVNGIGRNSFWTGLGLEDYVSKVLIPTEKIYQVKNGKKVSMERIFYPGYILIEAALTGEIQHVIRNLPHISGFLSEKQGGKEKEPTPLRQSEVNRILGRVDELADKDEENIRPFVVGETVKVVDGPFNGFDGTIEEILEDKKKLKVSVKIFGRKTILELNFVQVVKE